MVPWPRHGLGLTPRCASGVAAVPVGRRSPPRLGPLRRRRLGHGRHAPLGTAPRSPCRASSSPGRSGRSRFRVSTAPACRGCDSRSASWPGRGLTIWWSIAGDRSWDALGKGIVVLAFGVVGLAAAAVPGRPLRSLALLLAALLGVVLVWALLGKAIPALGPGRRGPGRPAEGIDRLLERARPPRGCRARPRPLARRLGARALRPAAGALLLFCGHPRDPADPVARRPPRGARGRGARTRLSEDRVAAALFSLLAACPAVPSAAWAFTGPPRRGRRRPRRPRPGRPRLGVLARRRRGGRRRARRSSSRPSGSSRGAAATWSAASSARRHSSPFSALLGLVLAVGNPVSWAADQLGGSGEVVNDPGRLGSLETNNRTVWWGEAWQVFRAHPAGGTGARTFEIARKRFRDNAQNVTEPHSVPLQLLAEAGLPGFSSGSGSSLRSGSGFAQRVAAARARGARRCGRPARAPARVRPPRARRLRPRLPRRRCTDGLVAAALLGAGRPRALARAAGSSSPSAPSSRRPSRLGARGPCSLDARRRPRLPAGRRGRPRRLPPPPHAAPRA